MTVMYIFLFGNHRDNINPNCCYEAAYSISFHNNARSHWLFPRHMTSNNATVSRKENLSAGSTANSVPS